VIGTSLRIRSGPFREFDRPPPVPIEKNALLFFWRRSILVTTLGGLAVLLALRLGLGW